MIGFSLIVLWLFLKTTIKIIRILNVIVFILECYPLSSWWTSAFAMKRRERQKGYAAFRLWSEELPSLTHLERGFWMSF